MKLIMLSIALMTSGSVSASAVAVAPSIPSVQTRPAAQPLTVEMIVKSSSRSELLTTLTIESSRIAKAIYKAPYAQVDPVRASVAWPDVEVVARSATSGSGSVHRIDRSGNLLDEDASRMLILPQAVASRLLIYAEAARNAHYGRLLPWNEARSIIPRKSIFTVVDLESGLSFRVQRRAGSDHADVQPIGKEDSRIMKTIYGGEWSWDRRAIVVVTEDGHKIAASMNGMPHGGDGIPDNDFKGHSCIHFLGSSSHKSEYPDPSHQLMINKAAGNLRPYLDHATPYMIAASFVEAFHQRDSELLMQIWPDMPASTLDRFVERMRTLKSIRIKADSLRKQPEDAGRLAADALNASVDLPVTVYGLGGAGRGGTFRFAFKRETPESPWRIVEATPPGSGTSSAKDNAPRS
ncbi:hypothetical protein ACFPPD_20495 [Cohnella suwonensis]|uniref:Copper amine oxidase-like N-terminal domain-containing protein n=1 Tax=Cohnella suwonensis TaxID=696072 RepID=A0ABW0LYY1_9BACL